MADSSERAMRVAQKVVGVLREVGEDGLFHRNGVTYQPTERPAADPGTPYLVARQTAREWVAGALEMLDDLMRWDGGPNAVAGTLDEGETLDELKARAVVFAGER